VIDHFITDIETLSLPVMIIIPGVVINELDGYENECLTLISCDTDQYVQTEEPQRIGMVRTARFCLAFEKG
jgi:hypothetical protein